MTLEAKKYAFKESLFVGIPTIILCAIIYWFLDAKFAVEHINMFQAIAANSMSVFVTSMICGLIQYPIKGAAFKKGFEPGHEALPVMPKLDTQVAYVFPIKTSWWLNLILFALYAWIIFGCGIPALLGMFGVGMDLGRVGVTVEAALTIGCGAWWAMYHANIFITAAIQEKAAVAMAAAKK